MTIDDEFDSFMRQCFPTVQQHESQWISSRHIWFAASLRVMLFMMRDIPRMSDEEGLAALEDLRNQLDDFLLKYKKENEIT